MPKIDRLASVDPKANLADDVEVGPFCVVGPDVTLGAGTRLLSHVVVTGHTKIGQRNIFHPHSVVGGPPQDLKYKGEPTGLEIGNDNHIRENCTIHIGTTYGSKINGGGITRIGDNNLLMVNVHVAHDVQIGSRCIIANNVMIAGHVVIGNNVILNGAVGINQWVTIGDFVYAVGAARIHHDVPPFVKVSDQDEIRALNEVGLKRAGLSEVDIEALEDAVRRLFNSRRKAFSAAMSEFDTMNGINSHVKTMIEFLRRRDIGKHGRYLESLRKK
jgi:UDP-N-acetylglucosamine acyltransferase